MKLYISIDELKYDIQQQADNLPDYIMEDHFPDKIKLQKAVEVYFESKKLFLSLPPSVLIKTLNNAIVDTLRDNDQEGLYYGTDYITRQIYALTQISNFIACAIPE